MANGRTADNRPPARQGSLPYRTFDWELRARAGRGLRRLGARYQPLVVCGSGLSCDYGPVALPAAVGQWPLSLEAPRHPAVEGPGNVRSGQSALTLPRALWLGVGGFRQWGRFLYRPVVS